MRDRARRRTKVLKIMGFFSASSLLLKGAYVSHDRNDHGDKRTRFTREFRRHG
jgi:hypothetical protein